jgi:glycosyltransferase involved in cell wall biosynthesis
MYHKRKRIAIIHPMLSMGGASAVAVWTIEALKAAYDVTLITIKRVNLAELNNFFGSNIQEDEITIKQVWRLSEVIPNGYLLKVHLAQRYYKQHLNEYDLAIATNCEMDLGKRGIQYINIPTLTDETIRKIGQMPSKLLHHQGYLRKIYKYTCVLLSGFCEERMKQNITLVNSNWAGQNVKEVYGLEGQRVYPPVLDDFPIISWKEREEGFVCIGCVSLQKGVETIIEIIRKIRQVKPQIHLHIIGRSSDKGLGKKINRLCSQNADWLFWEKKLSRKQLTSLVARHKYGIHGMPNEHFGIAVAEMAKAGCITFVPNNGGQVEIVADKRLVYDNAADAVAKITNVINNSEIQEELRRHLTQQRLNFSIDAFTKAIRDVVRLFEVCSCTS